MVDFVKMTSDKLWEVVYLSKRHCSSLIRTTEAASICLAKLSTYSALPSRLKHASILGLTRVKTSCFSVASYSGGISCLASISMFMLLA